MLINSLYLFAKILLLLSIVLISLLLLFLFLLLFILFKFVNITLGKFLLLWLNSLKFSSEFLSEMLIGFFLSKKFRDVKFCFCFSFGFF